MGFGMTELIIILVIVVILFGASRVPEAARSLGKSLGEFKKGMRDSTGDAETTATESSKKTE